MAGCWILFKCENLQKVGAFKFRGATNAVMLLDDLQAKTGWQHTRLATMPQRLRWRQE
jgi:threonine dehydratase